MAFTKYELSVDLASSDGEPLRAAKVTAQMEIPGAGIGLPAVSTEAGILLKTVVPLPEDGNVPGRYKADLPSNLDVPGSVYRLSVRHDALTATASLHLPRADTNLAGAAIEDPGAGLDVSSSARRFYALLKEALRAGSNVTITEDEAAATLTLRATGGGGGGGGGSDVEANPAGNPTGLLTKLGINSAVWRLGAAWADITGKPNLFSGSWADLTNKPTIPAPANVNPANVGKATAPDSGDSARFAREDHEHGLEDGAVGTAKLDAGTAAKKKSFRDRLAALGADDFEIHHESGYMQASGDSYADIAGTTYLFAVTNDDASTVYNISDAGGNAGWTQVKAATSGRLYLNGTMGTAISEFGQAGPPNRVTPTFAPGHVLRIRPRGTGAAIGSYVDLTIATAETGYYTWTASAGAGNMTALNGVYLIGGDTQPTQTVTSEAITNLGGLLERLRNLPTFASAHASSLATWLTTASAGRAIFLQALAAPLAPVLAALKSFVNSVRSPADPFTFGSAYARKDPLAVSANGQWSVSQTPSIGGASVQMVMRFQDADETDATDRWFVGNELLIGTARFRLAGYPSSLGNNSYQAAVVLIAGTLPAIDATAIPRLEEDTPHRSEFTNLSFKSRLAGAGGKFLRVNSGATDVEAVDSPGVDSEDTVPFAASFRAKYDRTFVTSLTGNTTGEAFISADNNVPAGLPNTVTDFLAMDQADAGGTDQTADLDEVAVGDWMRAKQGDKYIIARIAHISKALTGEFEFWFDTSTEIDETLAYDSLPNGAGEIRFYQQGESLSTGSMYTQVLNVTSMTTSWVSLPQSPNAYTDNTLFEARLVGLAANNRRIVTARFRLGDLDTNGWWLPWGAGAAAGYRIQFRRSAADTLQYQKQPAGFSTFRLRLFIVDETRVRGEKGERGAAGAVVSKNGVRRTNSTELSGSTGSSAPGLSLMTASYTPTKANAEIVVRLQISGGVQGADQCTSMCSVRYKRGSGNYKKMDGAADGFTAFGGNYEWSYQDWVARSWFAEYRLPPADNTDEVKVNVSILRRIGATITNGTGYLNRTSNAAVGDQVSWIEIYEMKEDGTMTYQTTTTLDSA